MSNGNSMEYGHYLPEREISDHFEICYANYNPHDGYGFGSYGVRHKGKVERYRDTLEYGYEKFAEFRTPPFVGENQRIFVYIFDTIAFTSIDKKGVPYIGLPSVHPVPIAEQARKLAEAEALHELCHVFNFREHPFPGISFPERSWRWLDEAMAVMMEIILLKDNVDYLRYAATWINYPDISLDHKDANYQAGIFAYYLEEAIEKGFINYVWTHSNVDEYSLDALQRISEEELGKPFAHPTQDDLFASSYCMDAYFLGNDQYASFAKPIFERFGEQAVRRSWKLSRGDRPEDHRDRVDHLARRYYRFFLDTDVNSLQLTIAVSHRNGNNPIKAEIALVTAKKERLAVQRLTASPSADGTLLTGELVDLDHRRLEHVVLVVSNCSLHPYDDKVSYTISSLTT